MRTLIRTTEDVLELRVQVRAQLEGVGFGLAAQTKMVAAVSAIAQNALQHGGGGEASLETLNAGDSVGLRVVISDRGPAIANVREAMRDGFTTGSGSGFGMSGAARLMDAFQVETPPEGGTRVTMTMWRPEADAPVSGPSSRGPDRPGGGPGGGAGGGPAG